MRKTLIACLILTGSYTSSFGQAPTLTAANMNPYWGDTYINKVCDTTGVTPGTSGPAQSWNFSGLTVLSPTTANTDTAEAVACDMTASCALFAGSNTAIVSKGSSTTNYIIQGPATLSQKGYWASATQNAIYTDPLDQFRYPFTYLSTFTDPTAGLVTYTPSGGPTVTATETSTVTTTADGYGTLVLPGGATYANVLRVHSSQTFRDSANLFGTPTVGTYLLESYTWYTPGYHSALLTISTASGLYNYKAVSYSSAKLRTLVPQISSLSESLQIAPNPVRNELTIQFNMNETSRVRISIADMMGREVVVIQDKNTSGTQKILYNTEVLARGVYALRLQSGNENVTRKIVVE